MELKDVDELVEVERPRVEVYTNVDIDYRPKELVVKDRERRWVVIVERAGKGALRIGYVVSRGSPSPEGFEEPKVVTIRNPMELVTLDLPDEVKSAIGLAISRWESEILKLKAFIALREVDVLPKSTTDREELAYRVARTLINKYGVTRVKVEVMGSQSELGLRCYDGKHWAPCEDRLEEWIGGELYGPQLVKVGRQLIEDVKVKVAVLNTKTVSGYRPLLSFENCVLDVERFLLTGDLVGSTRQHSQDLFAFHHIPHTLNLDLVREIRTGLDVYVPPSKPEEVLRIVEALSPRLYGVLSDLTYFEGVDPQVHRSRVLFMLEAVGRALVPGYTVENTVVPTFKNIFVLVGRKDTGKSTFLKQFLGDTILGEANYELVNLGKLGSKDPDEAEKALGKLARRNPLVAMHLDLSKRTQIHDWSLIRQASGGDPVPARRLYRDSFDYRPAWKIYVSTNDPPEIKEEGAAREALLGRFRVIETKNKAVRERPFPKLEERDVEVAIVASLYAIRRVYAAGEYSFTGVHDIEDALNRYTYPEYNVVMEMLEVGRLRLDPTLEISSSDLYQECAAYANEVRGRYGEDDEEVERLYSLPDQATFTKRLKKLLVKFKVRTVKRGPYHYFRGIGLARGGLM